MSSWLRSLYLWLPIGLLLSTACSSTEEADEMPAPVRTGAISGLISPAGAAVQVLAQGPGGRSYSTVPDSAGRYTFADLLPGTYQLIAKPLGRFQPRNPVQTTVGTAGFAVRADSLVLTLRSRITSGTMTWTVNGQTYTATNITGNTDELMLKQLTLTGTTAPVIYPQTYPEIFLMLPADFRGLGTYPLSSSSGIAHYHLLGFYPPSSYALLDDYYTTPTGGTLTISNYDITQGLLSGTFSFEARTTSSPNGPQTVRVTNGSFSVRF